MFKGVVLVLTFICLNYSNEYNNYKFAFYDNYYLDSNTWYTYEYSNFQVDYYVIGNYLGDNTHIHADFYPYSYMDSYIYTTVNALQYSDLDGLVDYFPEMFVKTKPRYTYSESFVTDSGHRYIYFAFHSDDEGTISFQFRTYFYSSFSAVFVVLIVLGGLLLMAGMSMGIAKAMGRSAWEGLACFCIVCTLFCCRR